MKKLMLGIGAIALLILVLFILVLSSNKSNNEELTKLTLKSNSAELTTGEKITLEVIDKEIDPKNDLLWYSDNTKVATVDQNTGEVNALSAGKAIITVKYKKDKTILDKCTITVTRQTSVVTLDNYY